MALNSLKRVWRGVTCLSPVWLGFVLSTTASLAQQNTIMLEVDATTIAKKLLHTHESFSLDSPSAHTVDLVYPIILSADGHVMDGMHRIAKAWMLGQRTITAVQFERDPPPDTADY